MSPRQASNGVDLSGVFRTLGSLESSVTAIERRQAEEIEKSAQHRQRVYDQMDEMKRTLEKNTTEIGDMMPVFKRAEEAEHARKVYKWQGRAVFTLIGGGITAAITYFLKHLSG